MTSLIWRLLSAAFLWAVILAAGVVVVLIALALQAGAWIGSLVMAVLGIGRRGR